MLERVGETNGKLRDYFDYTFILIRREEDAIRAVQYISLSSGGFPKPWVSVQTAICNIRQLAHNTLSRGNGRRVEALPAENEDIYLMRRVFTKVRLMRWKHIHQIIP